MFPFIHRQPSQPDPTEQEKLRQARWSFNTAIGISITSASISALGALLIAFGKIPPNNTAAIAAIASNLASSGFFQGAKDSCKHLKKDD